MNHDIKSQLSGLMASALNSVAPAHAATAIVLERPKQAAHGDFACSVALQLARALKKSPREIALALHAALPASPLVRKAEIAGAGFINFHLTSAAKLGVVAAILEEGEAFGRSRAGAGKRVQVEFVSANPTGPLHVGHGRGAAYGASLASLLSYAGWEVTREYYVNDAGRQMDILALSAWLRYLALAGVVVDFPANAYQGDYVGAMGEAMRLAHGDKLVRSATSLLEGVPELAADSAPEEDAKAQREARLDALIARAKELLGEEWAYVHQHVLTEQLEDCRSDLEEFGVRFDVWFSEKSLFDTGLVERCVAALDKAGHLYEKNGAIWFKSTAFGDEKDRVVRRDNGLYTYFASDIAYHLNKYERGFARIINIWGADHHGYIARVKGALAALDLDPAQLDIALVQFAVLYRNGEKASMSTRSGEFVTLRTLREEVGNDACRFFYVLRKSDQHLDFDLDLAKSQSNENPVYYIQYAHARVCSLIAQWAQSGGNESELGAFAQADLSRLETTHELALAAKLAEFPEVVESAASELSPHLIAFYLKDLAAAFHSYYNAERMLVDDEALRQARIAAALAVRQVIRNGLGILGVSCPSSM